MKILAFNIVAILLVLLTAYMIYADKQDWGYVLFAALLCVAGPRHTQKEKEKKDESN